MTLRQDMEKRYLIADHGYYSHLVEDPTGEGMTFKDAKDQLVTDLRDARDMYADALKTARRITPDNLTGER